MSRDLLRSLLGLKNLSLRSPLLALNVSLPTLSTLYLSISTKFSLSLSKNPTFCFSGAGDGGVWAEIDGSGRPKFI